MLIRRVPREICKVCGEEKPLSPFLGVCRECIISRFDEALPHIKEAHRRSREPYGLPPEPPKTPGGIKCTLCVNECSMGPGETGFCGVRWNENGRLVSLSTADKAPLYAYLDPHVTNCVAAWWCPAGTGLGYPRWAYKPGPEHGYYNLAVFFYGCSFNCLFCQNSSHKNLSEARVLSARALAREVLDNPRISCVCYFGGDPTPHLPFTLSVNRLIVEEKGDRIVRICYETNGTANPQLLKKAAEYVVETGGNIKFDIKAPSNELYYALCGVPAKDRVFSNFEMLYHEFWESRPDNPVIMASTLLVPAYIGPEEVERIAKFISSLDPNIPFSLLIFHGEFYMSDMPVTPRRVVERAYEAAKKYLKRVHVGNLFLLVTAPPDL